MDIVTAYVILGVMMIAIVAVLITVMITRTYRHKIIGIRSMEGMQQYFVARAKEAVRDGKTKWILLSRFRLKKNKGVVSAPPHKLRGTDNKGNFVALAYITDSDEPVYATYNPEGKTLEPYLSDDERTSYIQELRNARSLIGGMRMDIVVPFATLVILGLVIAGHLVFWEELSSPFIARSTQENKFMQEQTKQLEILRDIDQKIQTVGGSAANVNKSIPVN